jgi:hypothetical protein
MRIALRGWAGSMATAIVRARSVTLIPAPTSAAMIVAVSGACRSESSRAATSSRPSAWQRSSVSER